MQPSLPFVRVVAIILIGATLLLSSCVSKSASTVPLKTVAGERIVLHEGEYKEVYITGSNIPVLVSKSPSARPLPTASETITISPEEFAQLVRNGDVLSRR
jgi:hypothetical protein